MVGDDESGYEGYIVTTTDPGPIVLVATVVFSFLSLASLPFLVSFGRARQARHQQRTSSASESVLARDKHRNNDATDSADQHSRGDDQSVVSSKSSVASAVVNAILDSTPRGGPNPRRTRSNLQKLHHRQEEGDHHPTNDVMEGQSGGDAAPGSVLGKLSSSQVSFRDAVDHTNTTPPSSTSAAAAARGASPVAWMSRTSLANSFDKLLEIAEWDKETKRLFKLGWPFILQALLEGIAEAIRVAIIGRFIGTTEVTAYVMVALLVEFSSGIISGFADSLTMLCSQAIGAGNNRLAGQYLQMSIVLNIVCWLPFIFLWGMFMGDILEWLEFDEVTVTMAVDFTKVFVFYQLLEDIANIIHALLDVIDLEQFSTLFIVGEHIVSTLLVAMVALRPDPSLNEIALVYLFENGFALFLCIGIIMWKGWFDRFLGGMIGSFAFANVKGLRVLLVATMSLSFGNILTYGEWELLTVFASSMGPAEVAAWALLGTLWDAVEYVTEAVADAAEVRCSFLLGAGMPEKAKLSAYKAIYLANYAAMLISSCLFIAGDNLSTWMTTDTTLQRMLNELVPLFGVGNIALTLGTMSWTLVGSQGRYRLATTIGFAGSWTVTMPLAAISTFVFGFDLKAQTGAMVIGYMVSGTMNTYVLLTTDWKKQSDRVIEYSAFFSTDSGSESDGSSSVSASESNGNNNLGREASDAGYESRGSAGVVTRRSFDGRDSRATTAAPMSSNNSMSRQNEVDLLSKDLEIAS